MSAPPRQQQIVTVGSGFAGVHAERSLSRLARHRRRDAAGIEIVLIKPFDYFLYLPLLPEVTGGILDPRRSCPPVVTETVSPRPMRRGSRAAASQT